MAKTIFKHPDTNVDLIRIVSEDTCNNCILQSDIACNHRTNDMFCYKKVFGKPIFFQFKEAFPKEEESEENECCKTAFDDSEEIPEDDFASFDNRT